MRARPTIAFIAITSALVFGAAIAPASAATTTVTTIGEFTTALADCSSAPNTIVIGADIVDAANTLTVPCDTTIDLTTNDLTLRTLNIAAGVELEITGPTDGTEGVLTTNASSTSQAAIRTTGATLRVTGGEVHATGGFYGTIGGDEGSGGTFIVEGGTVTAISNAVYGSAIGGANGGGDPGGDGGILMISGGSVTAITNSPYGVAIGSGAGTPGGAGADITVTGGILTASGSGSYAATIGGGNVYSGSTGSAGTLTIGDGGTVVVSSSTGGQATVFGAGPDAVEPIGAPGTLVVDGDLYIPAGVLRMPTGTSVTVGATGRILGSVATPASGGSFVGPATITNNGIIALSPDPSLVTGNNRALTYSDSSPSTRVFAPSLDAGFRTLATPPTGTAWNTTAAGTGTWFSGATDTSGAGTTALFAAGPGSIAVSTDPADLVTTAGEPYAFPVTVLDSLGDPASPQPTVTFGSPDCSFGAFGVFEHAGPCTITANSGWGPFPISTEFDITVEAAAAASIAISPATASVDAGSAATFTVTAADEFGNPTSAAGATISSSVGTDTVSGLSVTPMTVGERTIAASMGSLGTTTPATLTATMPVVQWDAPDLVATAGVAVTLDAIVEDGGGTPFSPQPSITYTSTCAFTGLAVFTAAGICPVTASATLFGQPISTEFDVTVTSAPAATLEITPTATSVPQGGSVTFTVVGEDAFGNAADTSGAVLTSSVASDVVDGRTVSFPTASPHTITATLGEASASVTIDVIPAPAAGGIQSTGSTLGALALPLAGLAALLLVIGALVMIARRRAA